MNFKIECVVNVGKTDPELYFIQNKMVKIVKRGVGQQDCDNGRNDQQNTAGGFHCGESMDDLPRFFDNISQPVNIGFRYISTFFIEVV